MPSSSASPTPPKGSHVARAFEHATVADVMHVGIVTAAPEARWRPSRARWPATASTVSPSSACAPRTASTWCGARSATWTSRAAWSGEEPDAGTMAVTPAVSVEQSSPLSEAVGLMLEHGVTHLVVTDGEARPIGVLSTLDVAGVVARGRR